MGLWAGLVRAGWRLPVIPAVLPFDHGPLMVSGFLGALIALERVVALRRWWMAGAPLLCGAGWVLTLALPGQLAGPVLITLGSLLAVAILAVIVRREQAIYTLTMAVGMTAWLAGNLFWILGTPVYRVVWIWAAFLILTIAGERLELSRILRYRPWQIWAFALAAGVFLAGAVLATQWPAVGAPVSGAGLLALAAWLLRFDIARRNLRHPLALTRFIAVCLFTGYLWLGVSGLLNIFYGPQFAGLLYDAELHTVFVGFVMSMIFGHALIILPALTRLAVTFRRAFYLPVLLLHASLVLRIAGDLAAWPTGREWGGMLNVVAILGFMGLLIAAVQPGKRQPGRLPVSPP